MITDRQRLASLLRLMVITDRRAAGDRGVLDVVRLALAGGATAIQLRDKDLTGRDLCRLGDRLADLCRDSGALFIVNDRLDVALACGADGVHLGQDDLPVARARALMGAGHVIGISAPTPEEAQAGERDGADYLGVGAVFATSSKGDAGEPIGPAGLSRVVAACSLPAVAIGGVNASNAALAVTAGAVGVAVIAAVMAAADPQAAAARLLASVSDAVGM